MGWVGRDPNHDTSGSLEPSTSFGWLDEDRGRFRDTGWHHVAWQFRYRDQMNYLLVDGKLVRQVQLPAPGQCFTIALSSTMPRDATFPFA